MGLFDKVTGELTVKFYGNPKDTLSEDEVSAVYTVYPTTEGTNEQMAADFWKYAGKVLFCLGDSPAAETLRSILIERIKSGLSKNDNVLQGENYKLKKVDEKPGYEKLCHAKFYRKAQPKTKFSFGGEDYYAPMSVLAFLQHIIDNLSDENLEEVSAILQGFAGLYGLL